MFRQSQFRKVLPLFHTPIAIVFGGWGLSLRNAILSRPFWGSTGWHSTAVFHVWPWPFKFAAILNMPALVGGLLLSLPLDYVRSGLPEWVSMLPSLWLVPVLWYLVGSWVDKRQLEKAKVRIPRYVAWVSVFLFAVVSLVGSLMSLRYFGYTGFMRFGVAIWAVLGIGMAAFDRVQKKSAERDSLSASVDP